MPRRIATAAHVRIFRTQDEPQCFPVYGVDTGKHDGPPCGVGYIRYVISIPCLCGISRNGSDDLWRETQLAGNGKGKRIPVRNPAAIDVSNLTSATHERIETIYTRATLFLFCPPQQFLYSRQYRTTRVYRLRYIIIIILMYTILSS